MPPRIFVMLFLAALILLSRMVSAAEREKPVERLARQVYTIHTTQGDASIPVEISTNLNGAHPEITRAVFIFHGKGRNVEGYFAALERAAHESGVRPIKPCFGRRNSFARRMPKRIACRSSSCVGMRAPGPLGNRRPGQYP